MYTLGSLRPGGATWEYLCSTPIGVLKFRGRWAVESSLEHYVQECMAYLDFEQLSDVSRRLLNKLAQVFETLIPLYVQQVTL